MGETGVLNNFNIRASNYSKGGRVSTALTNYSYTQRLMATYATGLNENGWAFVGSGSRRWAEEGVIEGSFYDSWSYFIGVEKLINDKHSLNFTTFGSPYRRSGNSPNTQEVYNIKGIHYNAYWGWQDGKQRLERIRETFEPIYMLTHSWRLSNKSNLKTSLSYQTGKNSYSRLERGDDQLTQQGYQDFLDNPRSFDPKVNYNFVSSPSPIYYRYLSSYYNSDNRQEYDKINWDNTDKYSGPVLKNQINWDFLYQTNYWNGAAGLGSAYYLIEDVNEDNIFNFNTHYQTQLIKRIMFIGNISYQKTKSNNYRILTDLLGGLPIENKDFFRGIHLNILNENNLIGEGEKFNYNYDLFHQKLNTYGLFNFTFDRFDYQLGIDFTQTQFYRKGNYQNEYDLVNSLGNSEKHNFTDFGVKGSLLYKLNGKHFFKINSLYKTKAPFLNNSFINVRYLNFVPDEIKNNKIIAGDFNYIYRGKKLNAKISAYLTKIKDQSNTQTYYLDDDGESTGFLYQSIYGIDTRHIGIESAFNYKLSSILQLKSVISIGDFTYTNNPSVITYRDGVLLDGELLNTAYYKNYKISGTPQRAYNLGVEYRSPYYWWLSINGNILSHNYVSLNPGKHSDSFVVSGPPDSQETVDKLLQQERFSSEFYMNLSIGKSWKINKKGILASLNINNLLNNTQIKTGGFEQGYLGSYDIAFKESQQEIPKWGNKYWYQQGLSFFANLVYKF